MQYSSNLKFPDQERLVVIDRRQFLTGLTAALLLPRVSLSFQSGATKLTERVSVLTGLGTNVLSLSSPEGMLLVDSGAPRYTAQLMALTSRVHTVFNTHFHLE